MKGLFIGPTSIDIIYPLESFPQEDTKNYTTKEIIEIGGPATNAAYAFSVLGGDATLVSLVGSNPFTQFIKMKLENYGIHHIDLDPQDDRYPAMSSVIINEETGSRTLASTRPPVPGKVKTSQPIPSNYDVVCIDGFFADYCMMVLNKNSPAKPVVFDGGSYKPKTDELLDYVTYPILSEKFELPDQENLKDMMSRKDVKQFAVTHGGKSITAFDEDREFQVPVPSIRAIDSLGAGDIFHGAFCRYILEMDFELALARAARIASLSCQYFGTREWAKKV